jgi:hypothetical protein
MFYLLYLGLGTDLLELKKIITYIIGNIQNEGEIYQDTDTDFSIGCNWFTIFLNNWIEGISFASEDYKLDLKYQLWFELLSSVDDASEMMMYTIGRILEQAQGDAIILSNGETPILERRNGIITVDGTKLDGKKQFPFYKLGIEYSEGNLNQV